MALTLNPYINLRGDARAALEFYQSVLGGELDISEFASFPRWPVRAKDIWSCTVS